MAGRDKLGAIGLGLTGLAMPVLARAAPFDVDHATALYLATLGPAASMTWDR